MSRPLRKIGLWGGEIPNWLTQEEAKALRKDKSVMYIQRSTDRIPLYYKEDLSGSYGKAKVYEGPDGDYLRSYDTIVCSLTINQRTGEQVFRRYWNDWSRTTSNHVAQFLQDRGWHAPNKKKWLSIPLYTDTLYGEV